MSWYYALLFLIFYYIIVITYCLYYGFSLQNEKKNAKQSK